MLTTSNGTIAEDYEVQKQRQLNEQRERDIRTLKQARVQVIALRQTLQQFDTSLAYEFGSPARKIDEALAYLLLRRELESEAS